MTSPDSLNPKSDTLAEASPYALQDYFSRDPEGFQSQDLEIIISELRAMRARLAEAEAQGKRAPRVKVLPTPTPVDPTDIGL